MFLLESGLLLLFAWRFYRSGHVIGSGRPERNTVIWDTAMALLVVFLLYGAGRIWQAGYTQMDGATWISIRRDLGISIPMGLVRMGTCVVTALLLGWMVGFFSTRKPGGRVKK